VAVLIALNAVTPRMLVPPPMTLAIVITLAVTLVISAVMFHDTACCE
jgi:hypothetical protein